MAAQRLAALAALALLLCCAAVTVDAAGEWNVG